MQLPAARWLIVPAVFALALAGYVAGVAPGLLWGDSAEMQIVAAVGGVAHPSGYPLFPLLAQPFVRLLHGQPAFLANLFSGVFAAATLALLVAFLLTRGIRTPAALAAAVAFGTSFTFWSTSLRAEVYSLAAFMGMAGLWCALVALERGRRTARLATGLLLGLTLADHLVFAPFVMVVGLVLAWRVPRAGMMWLVDELALLVAFGLGLTPYLYLAWADANGQGFNFLHVWEIAQWPTQPVPESFRDTFQRVVWLITSRGEYPVQSLHVTARSLAKNLSDAGCLLVLFEWGPITAALAVTGAQRHRHGDHARETRLLLALAAATILFTVLISGFKLTGVFLIPCFLVCAVFVGHGIDAVYRHIALGRSRWGAALLALVLPFASAAIANASRLIAYDHPVGPLRSRVYEEDDFRHRTLLPSYAGYDEPRRLVESAAERFPDSALVVAEWREVMALFYLQLVEKRRTDLTLHPAAYPQLLRRVEWWQSRYPPSRRPVVVVGPFVQMSRHFDHVDTLRLTTGQPVWITRSPLVRLDSPWVPAPAKPRTGPGGHRAKR